MKKSSEEFWVTMFVVDRHLNYSKYVLYITATIVNHNKMTILKWLNGGGVSWSTVTLPSMMKATARIMKLFIILHLHLLLLVNIIMTIAANSSTYYSLLVSQRLLVLNLELLRLAGVLWLCSGCDCSVRGCVRKISILGCCKHAFLLAVVCKRIRIK